MNCIVCKNEMVKATKFKLVNCDTYDGEVAESTMNKHIGLYANKPAPGIKGWIGEGIEETLIIPSLYVCPSCGHIELKLTKEQIEEFVVKENEGSLSVGE